ncbi:hypothetical protein BV898_15831 [Hypsibius exemplaris]|uniref:Receptor ligand binding region domain-containing protein n=1 Tax=Hypsibius exemplaris TaxID=2072580 RepID=A0A9X6NBY3_HYPEX|nr:hypothetical protein BV898_15831 [Hypsibius exemplaris]
MPIILVRILLQTLPILWIINGHTAVIQVEIACPGFIDPRAGGNGALAYHGPAFEAAVRESNRLHADKFNFTLAYLSDDSKVVPPDIAFISMTPDLLAEWFYRKRQFAADGVPVIISPGNLDNTAVHQLTSAYNILCISTMAFTKSEFKLRPAPVPISFGTVSTPSIAAAIFSLLVKYNWRNVFLVLDLSSAPVYQGIQSDMMKSKESQTIKFDVRKVTTTNLLTFKRLLEDFAALSREEILLREEDKVQSHEPGLDHYVLNETLAHHGRSKLRDGRWISQQFLNRTFLAPGGLSDVYVDSHGVRRESLSVSHFTGENVSRKSSPGQTITNYKNCWTCSDTGRGGQWPPPNEPLCGFTHLHCSETPAVLQGGGLAAVLIPMTVGVAGLVVAIRKFRSHRATPWTSSPYNLNSLCLVLPGFEPYDGRSFFNRLLCY